MNSRERRAQLVRHRCDEVGFQLLEPAFLREIAERVDGAVVEGDAADRKPELPPVDLQRHGRSPPVRRAPVPFDVQQVADVGPSRKGLLEPASEDEVARQPGDRLGGRVPELDGPRPVDEQHSVGDRSDHARGLCALVSIAVEAIPFLGQPQALERMRHGRRDGLEQRRLSLVEPLVVEPRDADDAARTAGAERSADKGACADRK